MSAEAYYERIRGMVERIHQTQTNKIVQAAEAMATAIASGRRVWMFGSGHSVIPVMDMFPRYGSFLGLWPLYDPRLMWFNVIGPGGARELLWLERREGYVEVFLRSYPLQAGDVIVIFSHGGMNAAPLEAAMEARKRGLLVVSVSSHANLSVGRRGHSSGKALAEVSHIALDNCVPPEDALVEVGWPERVAAGSTVAAVFIAMSLVAETASRLAARGVHPPTFVSPNVPGVAPDHNERVFEAFARQWRSHD
ncbi:MAG: sugar isomerase domain-containing protein [Bryobacteraceae bacterium]